jgi:hypothetical protein
MFKERFSASVEMGNGKRLINFAYGAHTPDWKVWFSECSDPYSGESWDLIEREVEAMPGGWPVK